MNFNLNQGHIAEMYFRGGLHLSFKDTAKVLRPCYKVDFTAWKTSSPITTGSKLGGTLTHWVTWGALDVLTFEIRVNPKLEHSTQTSLHPCGQCGLGFRPLQDYGSLLYVAARFTEHIVTSLGKNAPVQCLWADFLGNSSLDDCNVFHPCSVMPWQS